MENLSNKVREFNETRSWRKYHDPRSLILALCGEVGELAQIFCWRKRSARRFSASTRLVVEEEIADILIYLLALCTELEIDPEKAVLAKLEKNEQRFPIPTDE